MTIPATSAPTLPDGHLSGQRAEVVDLAAWRCLPWARRHIAATAPRGWHGWEYEVLARQLADAVCGCSRPTATAAHGRRSA
ncbi:hypothetical protein FRACA_170014 [Frankia canadensis]|uniref:Uncharacterized protein n=1 Tax=Frankia canadensis TaxID=1836972 RepID=A0A2I2KN10_9ACTN|nr:hypothetical protein FRACA_170014 [Frankia canadensis]SOU54344.1 hypothetical protein FRACA_170014 [Frankia canadensis]